MKHILAIAAGAVLLGAATMPSLATPPAPTCTETSSHRSDASVPSICAVADTKDNHPTWYRDGGYCNGGTATTNVTATSNQTCVLPPG